MARRKEMFTTIDDDSFVVVFMAEHGYSNKAISEKTGLSYGQIGYRARMAGVFRRNYRDCVSSIAKAVWDNHSRVVPLVEQEKMVGAYEVNRNKRLDSELKKRQKKAQALTRGKALISALKRKK